MYQAFFAVQYDSTRSNIPKTGISIHVAYAPFAGSMFSSAPPGSLVNSEPLPPTSVTPPTILWVLCVSPVLILVWASTMTKQLLFEKSRARSYPIYAL